MNFHSHASEACASIGRTCIQLRRKAGFPRTRECRVACPASLQQHPGPPRITETDHARYPGALSCSPGPFEDSPDSAPNRSSTARPRTRTNSQTLAVTMVNSAASACKTISRWSNKPFTGSAALINLLCRRDNRLFGIRGKFYMIFDSCPCCSLVCSNRPGDDAEQSARQSRRIQRVRGSPGSSITLFTAYL